MRGSRSKITTLIAGIRSRGQRLSGRCRGALLTNSLHLGHVMLQKPEDAVVQCVFGHGAARARALHGHPHSAGGLVPALEGDIPAIFLHNGANLLRVRAM
jgi:hypothetical protein